MRASGHPGVGGNLNLHTGRRTDTRRRTVLYSSEWNIPSAAPLNDYALQALIRDMCEVHLNASPNELRVLRMGSVGVQRESISRRPVSKYVVAQRLLSLLWVTTDIPAYSLKSLKVLATRNASTCNVPNGDGSRIKTELKWRMHCVTRWCAVIKVIG